MRTYISRCVLAITAIVVLATTMTPAQAIEAIQGKHYPLTSRNGPWLIMVASFRTVPKDRRSEGGMTAEEAAQELVYELRSKGLPAYVMGIDAKIEKVEVTDRLGRTDQRVYAAQRDMISVLAGNYPSIEDATAQKTLAWVKKFHPKCIDEKNGAIYRSSEAKGPLSGAFLTQNPLATDSNRKRDPVVLSLNSGIEYPLVNVKKKYTLRVATFGGRTMIASGTTNKEVQFDRSVNHRNGVSLNSAGEDAMQLTAMLRKKGMDAYVYHDRYQSIVTIGGFNDSNDPEIRKLFDSFSAHESIDEKTGTKVLVGEALTLPGKNPNDPPLKTWIFDPVPTLIEVPRI